MPKIEIDYSNTIIYKIHCKDETVHDVYVGHTTNFVQRKYFHKQNCNNVKSSNYNYNLYAVIRANKGWNNWSMDIINTYNCIDYYEALKKEEEYIILYNATLYCTEPVSKSTNDIQPNIITTSSKEKKTFFCSTCDIHCNNSKAFDIHNSTKKHKNSLIESVNEKSTKKPKRQSHANGT